MLIPLSLQDEMLSLYSRFFSRPDVNLHYRLYALWFTEFEVFQHSQIDRGNIGKVWAQAFVEGEMVAEAELTFALT